MSEYFSFWSAGIRFQQPGNGTVWITSRGSDFTVPGHSPPDGGHKQRVEWNWKVAVTRVNRNSGIGGPTGTPEGAGAPGGRTSAGTAVSATGLYMVTFHVLPWTKDQQLNPALRPPQQHPQTGLIVERFKNNTLTQAQQLIRGGNLGWFGPADPVWHDGSRAIMGHIWPQASAPSSPSPPPPQTRPVANFRWIGITVDHPDVLATVTTGGKATFKSIASEYDDSLEIINGPMLPSGAGTYFWMDTQGRLSPIPETGFISKTDGIKLLCDAERNPIGFPDLTESESGTTEFTKIAVTPHGNDPAVQMGFYDFNTNEFIVSRSGKPEMTYSEYVERGPQNVYVAVVSQYELTEERLIPVDDDAPRLPFRWAMPVYGVEGKTGANIKLEPLPPRLGANDLWPVAVREGRFTREVLIRPRSQGPITGYLQDYQGLTVRAHYSLPEADAGGYSTKYGPPYSDVMYEEPFIVDDDIIQVRQPPILMVQQPTKHQSMADPVRPILEVYKRLDRTSPWELMPWPEIRDYNARTGEIHLRTRLTHNDSGLLRVDYASERRSFYFKHQDSEIINLNPYPGHMRNFIGKALHIYMLPEHVRDEDGNVIPESIQETTLRFTSDPDVFDPLSTNYHPLAVQLGVIYISTALDVRDITILDTRRRGGGIMDSANLREVVKLVTDAATYWDVNYGAAESYQNSGYVVIRLPGELRDEFSEEELTEIITRNITSGVGFKVEDLEGRDWS